MGKRWLAMACALSLGLTGCGNTELASEQLARVAKDWSLTIRASQVIPVYPLTEDLQPGDIFLVDSPIQSQVAIYESKGFLPLENLIARLDIGSDDYAFFYKGWPKLDSSPQTTPPRIWQFPSTQETGQATGFAYAPLVKFPTYNFTVSRSGALGLALPISGVPIGLTLLDSGSANGSVTMDDAYTYGLPANVLFQKVRDWSADNTKYLGTFQPPSDEFKYFLRVVHRVYLVKTISISLFDSRGSGAAVDLGVPQPVVLPSICNQRKPEVQSNSSTDTPIPRINATDNTGEPKTCFQKINDIISSVAAPGTLFGGSLKVTTATNRSIVLQDVFDRPVVVGYQAFDYPILANGTLGGPLGTLAKLEQREQFKPSGKTCEFGSDPNTKKIRTWEKEDGNKAKLKKWLDTNQIDRSDLLNCEDFTGKRQQAAEELKIP